MGGDRDTVFANAITVTASVAYVAGESIGGKWTFPVCIGAFGTGVIELVTVLDAGAQAAPMDIIFFSQDPASSTLTNKSAVTIHANDRAKVIGWVQMVAANYTTSTGLSIGNVKDPTPFKIPAGTRSLYAVAIARGTPTYPAASNISVKIGIRKD